MGSRVTVRSKQPGIIHFSQSTQRGAPRGFDDIPVVLEKWTCRFVYRDQICPIPRSAGLRHMVNRAIIVVPVHRSRPTPNERIGLRHLGRLMAERPILLVSPQTIETHAYRRLLPNACDLKVPPRWMESIRAYNRMMISPMIYNHRLLRGYSHMLLHEPDAVLLKDELDHWSTEPYDFIGSPWTRVDADALAGVALCQGANGGLSLTNLAAMRWVTSSWLRWHSWRHVFGDLYCGLVERNLPKLRRGLVAAYPGGLLRGAYRLYNTGWDIFFTSLVPSLLPEFRVAPPNVCVRFGWETGTYACKLYNNGDPPFGLHAWTKYEPALMLELMQSMGVDCSGYETAS